jgi:hypothetical protein
MLSSAIVVFSVSSVCYSNDARMTRWPFSFTAPALLHQSGDTTRGGPAAVERPTTVIGAIARRDGTSRSSRSHVAMARRGGTLRSHVAMARMVPIAQVEPRN